MILVIADDFSGAAELANVAVQRGLTAVVQTHFDPTDHADVIAIDTNSRLLPPNAAAERVRQITMSAMSSSLDWIFKKTDSVLRGNPRVEIEAMLDCLRKDSCTYIPANPTRGRTIVDGHYFVNGIPLHQTDFANDPHHPIASSKVSGIFGTSPRIHIPNISRLSDIPHRIDESLAAGGADFFASLLGVRPMSDPVTRPTMSSALLVCGSHHAWKNHRVHEMSQLGYVVLEARTSVTPRIWELHSKVMLCIGNDELRDASQCLQQLVSRSVKLAREKPEATILIEGGETSRAFVDAMGWCRWQALHIGMQGIAWLKAYDGSNLIVKPGSYAWPGALWNAGI